MQQESTEIRAPEQNSGDNVIFQGWLKEAGSAVTLDEPVAELETDKIVVEVAAPCDGILETLVEEGAAVTSEMLLGHVRAAEQQPADNPAGTAAQEQPAAPAPAAKRPERAAAADADRRELRLSPSVRQLVRKHDIADPSVIEGTGRRGRVTRKDVLAYLDNRQDMPAQTARATAPAAAVASQPAPDGGGERIPHSTMRRRVAEHMLQSVTTAPHVTAVFEADFSAIMAHRKAHKEGYATQGVGLTYTAYFIKACVEAMQAAPSVNSRWHDDYLEQFRDVNVGVGVALGDQGLVVPVIHKADQLSLYGIAARLQEVTDRARAGTLTTADVSGGTFTISNHGVSGSLLAAPVIINQPQSAILGVGALEKRVVVREVDGHDSIQIRPMAYVSLSIDHRVLDGAQTNTWLGRFVEVINNWPQT